MNIEVVPCTQPGCVDLRDAHYPDDGVLHVNASQWAEFTASVKRGDFDELTGPDETTRGVWQS